LTNFPGGETPDSCLQGWGRDYRVPACKGRGCETEGIEKGRERRASGMGDLAPRS